MRAQRAVTLLAFLLVGLLAACSGTTVSPTPSATGAPPRGAVQMPSFHTESPESSPPGQPTAPWQPDPLVYTLDGGGPPLSTLAEANGLTLEELMAGNTAYAPGYLTIPAPATPLVLVAWGMNLGLATVRLAVPIGTDLSFLVSGDPRWMNETVHFQVADPASAPPDWHDLDASALNEAGQAEASESSDVRRTMSYRAWIPKTGSHSDLASNVISIEWAPSSCLPTTADPPTPLVASDGTTYAFTEGIDANRRAQWSIVASNLGGVAGTGWRRSLDACWEPGWSWLWATGSGGTAYVTAAYRELDALDADRLRLIALGPDGIRAVRDVPTGLRRLLAAPDGTVYSVTDEIDSADPMTVHGSSLAALDPTAKPKAGWPFRSATAISDPVFGSDGTLYLGQSMPGEDRIMALGSDGQPRPGWPHVIPGELATSTVDHSYYSVPRSPSIDAEGWLYDAFNSGVYFLGPDGRPKTGWPYVMPPDTTLPWPPNDGSPLLSPFMPVLTPDGRVYLPRSDERTANRHTDLVCLLVNGSLCPGWPVRLPPEANQGLEFRVGRDAGVTVSTPYSWYPATRIRPDGTLLHVVTVGETLSGIAEGYGVTVTALLATNPQIHDPSLIHTGKVIEIVADETR